MIKKPSTFIAHKSPLLALCLAAAGLVLVAATPASAQSSASCDRYARNVANSNSNAAGNVLGGAAVGAVGGAIIGGIVGGGRGVGRGAAIGGGVGAVGGAAQHSAEWNQIYRSAYDDCMRGQVQRTGSGPEPWSDEWYDYCARKYRSFDPSDGTYQPYGGPRRLCR